MDKNDASGHVGHVKCRPFYKLMEIIINDNDKPCIYKVC